MKQYLEAIVKAMGRGLVLDTALFLETKAQVREVWGFSAALYFAAQLDYVDGKYKLNADCSPTGMIYAMDSQTFPPPKD